jgi:hypothetical protein
MAPRFARWQQATRDAGKAQPGARALMAALLLRFPGARSWGIYSSRNTALGNRSAHSEGRALDIGCGLRTGRLIVNKLLAENPAELGISVIIHDRTMYSRKSPNGRRYGGHDHRDHVHIEMTRKAASHLALRRAKRVLGL